MDIKKTLDDHDLWLETNGEEGVRANLYVAYLRDADLRGVNLSNANLYGTYLRDANLSNADLRGAHLEGANLRYADLRGAYLYDANLEGANLEGANLRDANLEGADLYGANLRGAKGILQWQTPQGLKCICYSVKHDDCVMHKLGCFWGTTNEAVEAIRKKYGDGSLYEKFLLMQVEALEGE